jgi:hypothetical protein
MLGVLQIAVRAIRIMVNEAVDMQKVIQQVKWEITSYR